jgi:hypothetical protein
MSKAAGDEDWPGRVAMGEEVAGGGPVLPIGRLGVDADVPDGIEEEVAAGDVDMMEDGDSDGGEEYRCVAVAG